MVKKTKIIIGLNKAFTEKRKAHRKRDAVGIHSKAQDSQEISLKIKPRWYIKHI